MEKALQKGWRLVVTIAALAIAVGLCVTILAETGVVAETAFWYKVAERASWTVAVAAVGWLFGYGFVREVARRDTRQIPAVEGKVTGSPPDQRRW